MTKTYWFSKKQGNLLDALGQPHNFVFVNGTWVRFTLSTEGDALPGTWPDFVSVASGDDIPTKMASAGSAIAV